MTQKTKQIITVTIIIIVAFIGFKVFFVEDDSSSATMVADNSPVYIVDGPAVLALLNRLKQVTLDESIFSNETFISLESFERDLENQVTGRNNPFLPIGVEGSGLSRASSTTR